MKKYMMFFRLRFQVGLQYRSATISAMCTQAVWALMECLAYRALQQSDSGILPMEFSALMSYIWLRQAFFAMFTVWATDNDIFDMIVNGGIAYELCRPLSVYRMWFARNIGGRAAQSVMRSIPILILASLVPAPYGLSLPKDLLHFILFLVTMVLALFVTVAFCMAVYMTCFFTVSSQGLRMVLTGMVELLSGAIIPLTFVPQPFRTIMEFLPFASMINVPLRVYSGNLTGAELVSAVCLQVFWLAVLVILGKWICRRAEKRVVVQGG